MADREDDDDAQELDPRVMLVPELLPGDRCKTEPGGRNAEVRFVGKVPGMRGFWVGVQYDEPVGKNDGTAKGTRYFECPPKYGGFLRPDKIEVGDFPEDDLFMSDEDKDAS